MEPLLATIAVNQWVSLPPEIRLRLVKIFDIPRSAGTHVENGVVTTDGYTYQDLKGITVEKMNNFLGGPIELDYFTLLNAVIDKAKEPEQEPVEPTPQQKQEQLLEAWKQTIEELKLEAESKGLLTEFKKLITNYGNIQKGQEQSTKTRGPKTKTAR